ncbi:hypothetical protein L3Q82_017311 [Scortum barcoo]|uniref:Uncharacterized protein n=1 Tax=Scortum barcoo TaxID=214431 RepID=A0ACB8VKU7_9TELE|nr:hypothetical protein L3Q82_017311 [Scortum barcoo]
MSPRCGGRSLSLCREVERYRLEIVGLTSTHAWALEPSSLRGAGPSTTLELPRARFVHERTPCSSIRVSISARGTRTPFRPEVDDRLCCRFHLISGRTSWTLGFRGRLGTLSPSGPCSLPPRIVDAWQFEVVDARSLVPVVVAIPEPGGGHRKPSKPQPGRSWRQKLRVWEEFGEAMEEDYRSASKRFWQTVRRLRRGKQYSANTVYSAGGELLTSTGDIVGRWKKYFEDLLNPTDLPSNEEAEAGDSEVDSSITQAEVTEVVRKLLGGKAPGVDEIRPEYLNSLDVVGLSWLTRLCNIAWRLGTVPLEWQTGVVVPLFKKGDRRVCSNYRGITLLSLPREGLRQGTGEENSAYSRPSDSGGTMRFSSQSWGAGPALYPPQGAGGFMGVCPTSPHVLCGSGEGIRPCPSWYSVGECSAV